MHRSGVYYKKRIRANDSTFDNLIAELWYEMPYYGYRRITAELQRRGYQINRKRVLRIMRETKIQALYPRPKTSMRNKSHKTYPYLLKGLAISHPNQVWATDITYIKVQTGWMYLAAIIDLYSRYVIAWRISNTLETAFCLDMLDCALVVGKPEILNTDQGSQFTCEAWISKVEGSGIKVSMDGKGRWIDNVIIERFWRTLKHEHILIHTFDTVVDLKQSVGRFIREYNEKRLHQSLGYKTPAEVYTCLKQSAILILGKNKVERKKLAQVPNASGGGLFPSPFLGGYKSQEQLKSRLI